MSSFKILNDNPGIKNIIIATAMMILIFSVGTMGYQFIEDMTWFEGLYMTFITISTIGFTEIHTLSIEGRVFTMSLFVFGIGVISYIASQTTQLLFESELFHKRAMQKRLQKMENHYIICGYGRIGHRIAEVLKDAGLPLVIVENREDSLDRVKQDQVLFIEGDAEDESVLLEAGIKKAKGLICTLSSDQDNVFTTLLARELNPNLFILVRTNENKNRSRVLRAGANKVISPYEIGADRMANVILRPHVDEFVNSITKYTLHDHTFDEVLIAKGSELDGKSLAEINVRNQHGVLIIAIIPQGESIKFNPDSSEHIYEGDSLILIGDLKQIDKFRTEVCNDNRSIAERTMNYEIKKSHD
ncbi:potassium channel family protein [Balneola vulgaris]|jgi:voltage-gated potassium channel|uniref:potassium channel family protein n=1 Tax=Balneola vulgaris TaxID=287535 RepID=UPI00035EB900|nr:potassium channel protein [Balneola vulgaris]